MSDIFEKEIFEVVCSECSKTFETADVNAEICDECWNKLINLDEEGK